MDNHLNRIQCSDKQSYDSTLSILEKHMNDNNFDGGFITNNEEFIIIYDFFPNCYQVFVSYMQNDYENIRDQYSAIDLYEIFTEWLQSVNYPEHDIPSQTMFGREIVKYKGVIRKRMARGIIYKFTQPNN
tara:strand:+ start:36 stop:425 length:390 start_codon:yes stop_codon:yes gene_type:complete